MSGAALHGVLRDHRSSSCLAALLLASVTLLASAAWAASAPDPVARVIRSLGVVEAVAPDGTVRRLGRQDPVFEGDTLRTGPRGRAQIRFTDRGLMSLRPETVLSLDDYEFDAASPSTARQEMSLRRGGFRAMTGRAADNNRSGYRVNTPLAVIGVRGTIWDGFQTPNGPLVLGVSQGGIDATTSSGRIARLGMNSGFNFARINMDGSVDYLVGVPTELEASAGLDEGDDGDDGSGDDDSGGGTSGGDEESGGLGSTEDSTATTGGGTADTTAGTTSGGSTTTVIDTASNTEGNVNQNLQGDGDLATTEPVLDPPGLSNAEETQLVNAGTVALATSLDQVSVASGIGVVTTDEVPVIAGPLSGPGFPTDFASTSRQVLLDDATFRLGDRSGDFSFMNLGRDTGGIRWGSFAAPVDLFGSFPGESVDGASTVADSLTITRDVLFAIGTPTEIANLTGSSFFASTFFDARTSGLLLDGVTSDAILDFGTGALSGILDVFLSEAGTGPDGTDRLFAYIVDFDGVVRGGLLQETVISFGTFEERTPGSFSGAPIGEAIDGTISGFVAGGEAEFLQLAFAYSTEARSDAAVSGLVFLDTPRLLSAEASALAQGFGFVGAFCCNDEGVAGGLAVDARQNGGNTILGVNFGVSQEGSEPLVPGEPGFADVPPDLILRNGGTVVSRDGFTDPGTDTLAAVVWTSNLGGGSFSGDGFFPGIQGFDPASGSPSSVLFDELFFVTGLPTTFANLTGQFAYSDAVLLDGRLFDFSSSAPSSEPIGGLDLFFNVDFGTGAVSDGTLAIRDGGGADAFSLTFEGLVGGEGGFNGADLVITSGVLGERGLLDLGRSELGGFFVGENGEAFAGAFALFGLAVPEEARGTFYALGSPTVLTPPNALTPAEATLLGAGFGYVEAVCCFDGRSFQGNIIDPRLSQGEDTVLGGGGVNPLDPLFNDLTPNGTILRRDGANVLNYIDTFSTVGGAELSTFEWQGFNAGGPVGIYDAETGELISTFGGNVLVLAGLRADIANLTGIRRYELDQLTQGFLLGTDTVLPQPIQGGEISFNVDFNTAAITGGQAFLFTDADDIALPSLERDRVEAFFGGTVGLANGTPHALLTVLGGFALDSDLDTGGNGIVDPMASSMAGFFAGDGSVFNLAFNLTTAPDPDPESAPFVEPINLVGTAILREADLSLTAAEQTDLGQGFVFVASECCGPEASTGAGIATNPTMANGDILFGLNLDGMGNDLGPLDPGFLDASPEQIARLLGGFPLVLPDFPVPPEAQLVAGIWFSPPFEGAALIDPVTGDILEFLGESVLFMVGQPSSVATLQAAGFQTFAGDAREFSNVINDFTLGGLLQTNVQEAVPAMQLDPDDVFVGVEFLNGPEATVSFNVDFATGQVTNGHLFTALVGNTTDGEEGGLQLFFDGSMNLATGGNPFVEVNIVDGTLGGVPLNFDETDVEIFFIGDGAAAGSSIVAIGSYQGVTLATPDFPDPIVVSGTFSIGSELLPEVRLTAADAAALNGGRFGIVAYSELQGFFPGADAAGAGGLILGRANAPTGPNSFFFAGNRLDEQAFDPVTGSPLGVTVQTARRDFLSQPYDFVVRQDSAMESLFSADAVPTGGSSLTGFEIAWGIWNGGPSTPDPIGAKIQDAPGDAGLGVIIDRDLFFTSVNPTPRGQMPVTGIFSYSTAVGATNGTDFLGVGGGSLLVEGSGADPLQTLDISFSLDFGTGDITSGLFSTSYSDGMSTAQWTGNFNGFVNGPLADLEFTGLSLLRDGNPTQFMADLGASDITGVFTGPNGERLVGGFNLFATDGLSDFEAATGVFILDRLPAGPQP